jgi:dolichol-phosphate mannosyltransferase
MAREAVSIIVPTYKEAENIPTLVRRVFSAMHQAGIPAEMVIVDDDSKDGTDRVVKDLASEFAVRLITRTEERGLSSAVVRGFKEARHDILLCMDADLSHPPESLPEVIAPIRENRAEFCIGSRYVAGGRTKEDWGLLRKLNSLGATLLARPLTSATDPMAGFFCLRHGVLKRAEEAGLNPIGYKIGLEILVKARCRQIAEIPIEFSDRLHGRSKLTLRQQLLYLKHLAHLYRFCWPIAAPLVGAILVLIGALAVKFLLFR